MAVMLLITALAMGSVVYAQTYSSEIINADTLKKGDVVKAGCKVKPAGDGKALLIIQIDGGGYEYISGEYTLEKDLQVSKIEKNISSTDPSGGGSYVTTTEIAIDFVTYTLSVTDTETGNTNTDTEKSTPVDPVAAWKASNANPDNYLPKTTLADGTVVQSTVSSHFTGDEAAVIAATPEADFNKALGISGGYAHIMGSVSQCGEKLKAVFNDYAKLLGDDVKVGDIFELTTEVREKNTYKLLDTVKESSEPVTLSKELQGELLKAAKAGCDFAVICYTDGKAILCKDVDTEVSTITINTTITSGTYAIIYGPKGCFDGIQ